MGKIIKEKQQPKANVFALKTVFPKFWKKYKMFVGYIIACTLAVIYLTVWPFDGLFFAMSVIWGFSFLRLRFGSVRIYKISVIAMWAIFCFGISGIFMQALKFEEHYVLPIIIAGIDIAILYSCVPIISYYLKYNDELYGWNYFSSSADFKTKYNGAFGSLLIVLASALLALYFETEAADKKEQQFLQQQFNKEIFVPVKIIETESFNGTTYYVLEAKGEKFFVSPFEYPEVRNIKENSEVKVILGDVHYNYRLKGVKKIQFKN